MRSSWLGWAGVLVVVGGTCWLAGCSTEEEVAETEVAMETNTPIIEPAPEPEEVTDAGPALPQDTVQGEQAELIAALQSGDDEAAHKAALALTDQGEAAVAALAVELENPATMHWAVAVLSEIGPSAKAAVPALTKVVKHDAPDMRMNALLALGAIGPDAAKAEPAVIAALDDPELPVRYAAAVAAAKIGSDKALPKLKELQDNDDQFMKTVSAWAVAMIARDDEEAVKKATGLLVDSLSSDNVQVRRAAARGMFELNAPPEVVGEALVAALSSHDPHVRAHVIDAVAALGGKAVPRIIERGLSNPQLQHPAVIVLGKIGPDAKEAVPALIELLGTDNDELQRDVQYALGEIGPASKEAVSPLTDALKDENPEVVSSALFALAKIGPAAKSALPAVTETSNKAEGFQKVMAVWALLQIDPDNDETIEKAVPLLITALESDRPLVRYEAAMALGGIGPKAASATDALKKLEKDEDEQVRTAAATALKKIGG